MDHQDENSAVAVQQPQAVAVPGVTDALSVQEITGQVALIQGIMKAVMRDNEHYGTIPGTNKPTLLKPGAEKLCLTFRFAPEYQSTNHTVLQKDFIFWDIDCKLIHIPTGQTVGHGKGSCNSREEKYGYRNAKQKCPVCEQETVIKGKVEYGGGWLCYQKKGGCGAKFEDGDQSIESQQIGKVPNENIWDLNNTIEKMACKRALVAAVLNATAASDIFTQDLEDMPSVANAPQNGQAQQQAPPKPRNQTQSKFINEDAEKNLIEYASSFGIDTPELIQHVAAEYGCEKLLELKTDQYGHVRKWIQEHKPVGVN